jgi:hypothetical protein
MFKAKSTKLQTDINRNDDESIESNASNADQMEYNEDKDDDIDESDALVTSHGSSDSDRQGHFF